VTAEEAVVRETEVSGVETIMVEPGVNAVEAP
jgi:hypothetical protein